MDQSPFGFDQETQAQLQALIAQMGPSEEDKKRALIQGLLGGAAAAFQNTYKPGLLGVGAALSGGLQNYNDELKQLGTQRQQSIQAAATMLPVMRQNAGLYTLKEWQQRGGAQLHPATGETTPYAPRMGSNFSLQPSTRAAVGGVMNDPGGNLPGMNLTPAALPAPPAQAPLGSSTGIPIIDQAINVGVPPAALMAALQGPDWATAIGKMISEYGKAENLRASGTMVRIDPMTGQPRILYRAPALAAGQTVDQQGSAVDVPGAQAGLFREQMRPHVATALSTSPETIMPGGGKGYIPGVSKADILWPGGNVPGFGNLPAGTYSGKTAEALSQLTPNFNPDEVAKIQADMARSGIPSAQMTARNPNGSLTEMPVPGSAGPMSPQMRPQSLAQRTFQTELSPQVAAESKSYGDALTKRWEEIASAGRNGAFASGRWGEMQKLANQFDSGAFTPFRSRIASYFNAMGASPDTVSAVAGGSLPAMEGFGKLAFESTLNQIKSFTSRPAMQEVVLAMQNNPNVQMTVPGRNLLLQTNKALADYNVQMYKAAQQYRQAHHGSIDGFEESYLDQHPPEKVLPSLDQIEAAGRGPTISGKPQATGPLSVNTTATYKAVQAAKSGKDVRAVRQRLIDSGFDPSAFDQAVGNAQR